MRHVFRSSPSPAVILIISFEWDSTTKVHTVLYSTYNMYILYTTKQVTQLIVGKVERSKEILGVME